MARRYLRVRRVSDRVIAGVLLAAAAPLMLAVAIAIRLSMGSPVLFRQERYGEGGTLFRIIKFRTLVRDAEAISGGYETPEQNLIPPLGAALRASSLDELPQLLNIVRGEMAFIGPRPALPDQVERYTARQRGRLTVPQGITGLAQVRYRHVAPWSLRIESDLEYVDRLSVRLDAELLLRTIWAVVSRRNVQEYTGVEIEDFSPAAVVEGSSQ